MTIIIESTTDQGEAPRFKDPTDARLYAARQDEVHGVVKMDGHFVPLPAPQAESMLYRGYQVVDYI